MHYSRKLIESNIYVACSAGVDSLAALHHLSRNRRLVIRAWHFNHKIRSQNDQMEHAVRDFCSDHSIELQVESCKEKYSGGSAEAFYREQRYSAMTGMGNVVVAHHLNDFTENYLSNCLKGHPDYFPMPLKTVYPTFNIIRPYCLTTKKQMIEYAEKNDILKYVVEDETNVDQSINRNWLRHGLIPLIQERNYNLETVVKKKIMEKIRSL